MIAGRIKQIALAAGFYRSARLLHRALIPSERAKFEGDLAFYRRFIHPGDLCFDIGANIGAKTEAMLVLGAIVVSVEPQPQLAREIAARGSRYGAKSIIVESAVGEQIGTATLHLQEAITHASLLDDWPGKAKGEIQVKVTTLDALIAKYGVPRLCKIDVEGFEVPVLRGLSHRIPIVTIEYHTDERCVALARECIDLLGRFGPIEINVTGESGREPLFSDWLPSREFLKRFPACVASHSFGDMMIRTV